MSCLPKCSELEKEHTREYTHSEVALFDSHHAPNSVKEALRRNRKESDPTFVRLLFWGLGLCYEYVTVNCEIQNIFDFIYIFYI
jgi:hypothetical protein